LEFLMKLASKIECRGRSQNVRYTPAMAFIADSAGFL